MVEVVNNIAPLKTARINNTRNEWFDKKNAEKLSIGDKLFEKFKSIGKSTKRQEMTSKEQSNRRKNGILGRNSQKI